ncbi:hypothetical protein HK097_003099 [Rhizophlyctis rosea]|uniref:Low temperature requirement A n=1 Tax=Rhizophlyctis rosea TaxID=64517 RepID=A0AAD5SIE7_9FUNG|nr:hypothetical protein HK097_003099 [Rhizophlyctis rosea]
MADTVEVLSVKSAKSATTVGSRLATLAPRVIHDGARRVHVYETSKELTQWTEENKGQNENVEACVLGGAAHIAVLKRRVKELASQAESANADREAAAQREASLKAELDSFRHDLQLLDPNAPLTPPEHHEHHTVKDFGSIPMVLLPEEEHSDVQLFWEKPRVRQYLHNLTTLHREESERKTTWLELFFDLLFVGLVAIVGHHYVEHPSSAALGQYILLFLMSFRTWMDMLVFYDSFASNDVVQKIFVVWIMALLVGLGVNITYGATITHVQHTIFYLLTRLSFSATYLVYILHFPHFRASFIGMAAGFFISLPFWIAALVVDEHVRLPLMWIGVLIDVFTSHVAILLERYIKAWPKPEYRLAVNIEHLTERYGLFLIIVIGEVVIALFFPSESANPTLPLLKAIFGLLLALNLSWIYFDADGSRQALHAMRRSAWAGLLWGLMHIPVFCALVLAGSSMGFVVRASDEVHHEEAAGGHGEVSAHLVARAAKALEMGEPLSKPLFRTFFGALSMTLLGMSILGACHKSPDNMRIRKWFRTGLRVLVAIFFAALAGVGEGLSPMGCIGVAWGLTLALVILETYSRTGRREDPTEVAVIEEKTAAVK